MNTTKHMEKTFDVLKKLQSFLIQIGYTLVCIFLIKIFLKKYLEIPIKFLYQILLN